MIWIRKIFDVLKKMISECYLICTLLLFAAVLFGMNAGKSDDINYFEYDNWVIEA
jgi:hypothetical protein